MSLLRLQRSVVCSIRDGRSFNYGGSVSDSPQLFAPRAPLLKQISCYPVVERLESGKSDDVHAQNMSEKAGAYTTSRSSAPVRPDRHVPCRRCVLKHVFDFAQQDQTLNAC